MPRYGSGGGTSYMRLLKSLRYRYLSVCSETLEVVDRSAECMFLNTLLLEYQRDANVKQSVQFLNCILKFQYVCLNILAKLAARVLVSVITIRAMITISH